VGFPVSFAKDVMKIPSKHRLRGLALNSGREKVSELVFSLDIGS
jgi:hypothetical protein